MTIETVGELIQYLQRYNPGMRILKSLPVRGYIPVTIGDEPDTTGNSVYHVKTFISDDGVLHSYDSFIDAEPQDPGSFEAIVL